ncbi:FAD-dependent oxidoreductase [Dolichospermum sp. ST_sed1]|nr:FAD-dependent oxidoreductase [Dolichospermum sp. ST_sed1]
MIKLTYKFLKSFFGYNFIFKMRKLFIEDKINNISQIFLKSTSQISKVSRNRKIVVIGSGVSSFSFCKSLKKRGFNDITIISKDELTGGKCVHNGCMLMEYFFLNLSRNIKVNTESLIDIANKLGQSANKVLFNQNINYIQGFVSNIDADKKLVLIGKESIAYDELIVATGNTIQYDLKQKNSRPITDIWNIVNSKVCIVSEGNVATLQAAEVLHHSGCQVMLIFTKKRFILELPSIKHYVNYLKTLNLKIVIAKKHVKHLNTIEYTDEQGIVTRENFDEFIFDFPIISNIPNINNKIINSVDIDYSCLKIKEFNNVYFLGDVSGTYLATECEIQAELLAENFASGKIIDHEILETIPLRFHSQIPFAMIGPTWTLFEKRWNELDFINLGWSFIHRENGKIWYIYNKSSNMIEAIHIWHKDADTLINIAALLISYPITDYRWNKLSVHPSSSEIFKLLRETILSSNPLIENTNLVSNEDKSCINYDEYLLNKKLTNKEKLIGNLVSNKWIYDRVLFGLKTILKIKPEIILFENSEGKLLSKNLKFDYNSENPAKILIEIKGESYFVISNANETIRYFIN